MSFLKVKIGIGGQKTSRMQCAQPREERPMSFHPNSIIPEVALPRPVNECAQCGEQLFVPEWSEYVDERRARHLWQCEACGYAFETTVSFAKSAA
jgi:hypothetical protein